MPDATPRPRTRATTPSPPTPAPPPPTREAGEITTQVYARVERTGISHVKPDVQALASWARDTWGHKMGPHAKNVGEAVDAITAYMQACDLKKDVDVPAATRTIRIEQRPAFDHVVFFQHPHTKAVFSVACASHVEQMACRGFTQIAVTHLGPLSPLPLAVEEGSDEEGGDEKEEDDDDAPPPPPTDVLATLRFGDGVPDCVVPKNDEMPSVARQLVEMFELGCEVGEERWSPLFMWTKSARCERAQPLNRNLNPSHEHSINRAIVSPPLPSLPTSETTGGQSGRD